LFITIRVLQDVIALLLDLAQDGDALYVGIMGHRRQEASTSGAKVSKKDSTLEDHDLLHSVHEFAVNNTAIPHPHHSKKKANGKCLSLQLKT
jgi:hypothetical protein